MLQGENSVIVRTESTSFLSDINEAKEALHESIEIKCFYEGTSILLIGDKKVSVKKGDVVVINPYEFHSTINCGEKEKGKYHLFMIPVDYFFDENNGGINLRDLIFNKNKRLINFFENDTEIYSILMRCAEEFDKKDTAYNTMLRALLTELFVFLLRKGIAKTTSDVAVLEIKRLYWLIEPAVRFIRDNYSEDISIELLSQLCNVSKHYFCRIFKTVTGKTAMEYLRDYRIEIANALLLNTKESIFKISEECGFESESYFCRCYKKYYGISPTKNRKG